MTFSLRFPSLRTLVRYGLGMTGNSEESGAGGGWLAPLFHKLKTKVEETAEVVCNEKINDADGAEKLARRIGVIARSARLVEAIRPRVEADSEEDGMGGRNYDPEETERLRRELVANCDRLDLILEEKRAEAAERTRAKAALPREPAASTSD